MTKPKLVSETEEPRYRTTIKITVAGVMMLGTCDLREHKDVLEAIEIQGYIDLVMNNTGESFRWYRHAINGVGKVKDVNIIAPKILMPN